MHASEPPCNSHRNPDGHPLGPRLPGKHEFIVLARKVLDSFGLLALLGAALLLFAAHIGNDEFDGGQLIRLSIATLNVSVLSFASARLLQMIGKAKEGGDARGQWYELKRSGDLQISSAPDQATQGAKSEPLADEPMPASDNGRTDGAGSIHYTATWRTHVQIAGAPTDEPGSATAIPTLALNDTPRIQDTDAASDITTKNIH